MYFFWECPWDRVRLCSLESGLPVWPSSHKPKFEASGCDFILFYFFQALIVRLCSSLRPTFCVFVKMCVSVCSCVSIGLQWDSQGEIDGALHVERHTQLLCMLYESVTPSLLPLFLLCLCLASPSFTLLFMGGGRARCGRSMLRKPVTSSASVLGRHHEWTNGCVEIDDCWSAVSTRRRRRMEGSNEGNRKWIN